MSVQAISWVLDHSMSRLGARCVLIAIANHAKADGTGAWPSMFTIAQEARLSEREVQYAIGELKKLGELGVKLGGGRGRPNLYHLPLMGARIAPIEQENGAQRGEKGCTGPPERVHTGAGEPSKSEPSTTEPPIVPVSVWLNFVEMRKKSRKPLTGRAGELVRLELAKFKERGFDPVEILENSIRNGWLDVYEPREGTKNGARSATTRGATRAEQRVTEADRQSERVFGRSSGLVGSLRPDLQGRSDGAAGGGLPGDTPRLAGKSPAPSLPASTAGVSAVPTDTGPSVRNSGKPAGAVREPAKVPG